MHEISQASHSVSFNGGGGYSIYYQAIPQSAIDKAMKHIQLDIAEHGLPKPLIRDWRLQGHWFPHLRWDAEIIQLADYLPFNKDVMRKQNRMCDPQIVLHWPDDGVPYDELIPHVDTEPVWVGLRSYCDIFMVPLTKHDYRNGGTIVWDLEKQHSVELNPGDLFRMDPETLHANGRNETGFIRYAIYFRFLEG